MEGSRRSPVSVILPTREWGIACEQLAAQLRPDDELLVICDTTHDPVTEHDPPDGVRILVAGEPDGCAAKANAIAYGMEQASHDRFVWTDDDYERDSEWLDRLVKRGETHGPAAVEPLMVSHGPYFKLLEPVFAIVIALYDVYRDGGTGGYPWGGGVTFTRGDLRGRTDQLCSELRESISDDNVLEQYLEDTYTAREWRVRVPVADNFADTIHRLVRWMRADHVRQNITHEFLFSVLLAGTGLLFPMIAIPLITVTAALSYRKLGYSRWTFLLAYPGILVLPLVTLAGIVTDEFRWGSRRYQLTGLYDVDVRRTETN